jgi:hypothetical protein
MRQQLKDVRKREKRIDAADMSPWPATGPCLSEFGQPPRAGRWPGPNEHMTH